MKGIKVLMLALVALVTCSVLSSCSDDEKKAYRLSGEWHGDFGMYYTDNHGRTWDSYNTYLMFDEDGLVTSHGTGMQVDYYDYGPYVYLYSRFNWHIRNGVIYLKYLYNDDYDTEIFDYHLSFGHFCGYLRDSNVYFDLNKLSDWDWSPFCNDWGYDYRSGYVYTKEDGDFETRGTTADTDSVKIVKIGNRFSEGKTR